MEELIFFAVIIFFSIIESIARSRKAKQQQGEPPDDDSALPDPREWEARFPDAGQRQPGRAEPTPSSYDRERSYDEYASSDDVATGTTSRGRPGSYRPPTDLPQPASSTRVDRPGPSSETMLPGDLLEQLEALAQGRQAPTRPSKTVRAPRQSPPIPRRIERTEVGTGHASTAPVGTRPPISDLVRPDHVVHRSHAGYGTDPSSRAPSEQDGLDPLAERLSADASAARRQLRSLSRSGLRQAIILREVLGSPIAMREEHLG